jgi:hypothetical protein
MGTFEAESDFPEIRRVSIFNHSCFLWKYLRLFHWGILSLRLVDDSACDFTVISHGYLCNVSSVLSTGIYLLLFSLEDNFPCDFVDNLIWQKNLWHVGKAPQSRHYHKLACSQLQPHVDPSSGNALNLREDKHLTWYS